MYAKFYGLSVEPFGLSPDRRFCYRHPSFARAKAYCEFAIQRGEGFVVVTGRPGTGKTTLIQDLVPDLCKSAILVACINRTQVEADDLLRLVAYAFGIDARHADKASLLQDIESLLRRGMGSRNRAVLMVDEAQNLPPTALEELRLITNLQDRRAPLVQIFLVGQESLRTTIRDPSLEQLHQRIVAACHIEPLSAADMRAYIEYRLLCAGWRGDPQIRGEALGLIHLSTLGIPRLVNKFVDRLLTHGGIDGRHVLTLQDVRIIIAELRQEALNPQEVALSDLLREASAPSLPDLTYDPADAGAFAAVPVSVAPGEKDLPADRLALLRGDLPPPALVQGRPLQQESVDGAVAGPSGEVARPGADSGREESAADSRASVPPLTHHSKRRRLVFSALALGIVLAVGLGVGRSESERLGELAQKFRASVEALAERWLGAWGGRGRPLEGAGRPGLGAAHGPAGAGGSGRAPLLAEHQGTRVRVTGHADRPGHAELNLERLP